MATNIDRIVERLGADVVVQVPETGGGAYGAVRLAHLVESLQTHLVLGQGKRAGRPSVSSWACHPKVPISRATEQPLIRLAERASTGQRKVSPMQIAAQILEDALGEHAGAVTGTAIAVQPLRNPSRPPLACR